MEIQFLTNIVLVIILKLVEYFSRSRAGILSEKENCFVFSLKDGSVFTSVETQHNLSNSSSVAE